MRHRRTGGRSLAVLALIVSVAACAACTPGGAPARQRLPAASGSSAGMPTAATGGSARPCLSGTVTVDYPAADHPLRGTCVHTGTTVRITLEPLPNHHWAPVTSSDTKAVSLLDDHLTANGARSATARADSTGTATLDSADTYTPDPHGPPSRGWHLILTVVP